MANQRRFAETAFSIDGDHVNAKVTRHGVTFLELDGRIGGPADSPKQFAEYFYCYKALPAAVPDTNDNGGFDGDVLLTMLTWERDYTSVRQIEDGRIILREARPEIRSSTCRSSASSAWSSLKARRGRAARSCVRYRASGCNPSWFSDMTIRRKASRSRSHRNGTAVECVTSGRR